MSATAFAVREVTLTQPPQPPHLRAVPDDVPRISRHAPDPAAAQRLDDALVAAGRGSAQAFEGVYIATAPQVYRLALRVVRDPAMAEDVTQEALVEVWRKAAGYDPARGTARAWVLTIAHRRAVDRVRREQRQREQMEAEARTAPTEAQPAEQDAVVEQDFTAWQSDKVRDALETLSEKQRQAIELAYFAGRTHTEVSEQLGIPLGTAKTRIRDALTSLRNALREV